MLNSQKVSVIIPVYNSEKFLKESLESVIHQTYSDVEIIAINDGSTDNSLEILKKYENKITIINQKNMGLAEALNAGIKKMSGHWLKWLSPDDILYPNAIEILVEEAKKLPENTILYSNWTMIDEKGKKLRDFYESNYNELSNFDYNVRLLDGQQINVNTTLIPHLLFSKNLSMNTLIDIILVDYDFFLRAGLLHQTRFFLIEKPLIKYRIHDSQQSHQKILASLKNLEITKNEILSSLTNKTNDQYLDALRNYKKTKSINKKFLETGLKIISKTLPSSVTDKMLVFYLNKIRRSR